MWMTYSQMAPAVVGDLRWMLIVFSIAIIIVALIVAALILIKGERTAAEARTSKTAQRKPTHEEAAKGKATVLATPAPTEATAAKVTTEEEVPVAPMVATTGSIIASEKLITEPAIKETTESEVIFIPPVRVRTVGIAGLEKGSSEQGAGKTAWAQPPPEETAQEQVAPAPPETIIPLGITGLTIDPAEVGPGEAVIISFKATNISWIDSPYYGVSLKINGETVAAKRVKLARRATLPMNFTVVGTLPGDYEIDINSITGKFTISQSNG